MEGGKIGILSLSAESCSQITLLMHSTHAFSSMLHSDFSLLAYFSYICQHNTRPFSKGVETKYRSKRCRQLILLGPYSVQGLRPKNVHQFVQFQTLVRFYEESRRPRKSRFLYSESYGKVLLTKLPQNLVSAQSLDSMRKFSYPGRVAITQPVFRIQTFKYFSSLDQKC